MKPKYTIVNATPEHVAAIMPKLRMKDKEDLELALNCPPLLGLLRVLALSPLAWAALDEEGVIAIWGVGSTSSLSDIGHPWLVGTERLIKTYRKPFLRLVDLFLDMMVERYPQLEGYQLAKNAERVRWLTWCGFRVEAPELRGSYGEAYSRFSI